MTTPTAPTAHEDLSRALAALLARDRQPPCCDGSGRWVSDDSAERVAAAERCAGCELFGPCGAAGQYEDFGVWGAVDRTRTPGTARRRDKAGAA